MDGASCRIATPDAAHSDRVSVTSATGIAVLVAHRPLDSIEVCLRRLQQRAHALVPTIQRADPVQALVDRLQQRMAGGGAQLQRVHEQRLDQRPPGRCSFPHHPSRANGPSLWRPAPCRYCVFRTSLLSDWTLSGPLRSRWQTCRRGGNRHRLRGVPGFGIDLAQPELGLSTPQRARLAL